MSFPMAGQAAAQPCNELQQGKQSGAKSMAQEITAEEALLSWSYWLAVPLLPPSNPIICVHPSLPATLGNIIFLPLQAKELPCGPNV